VDNARRGHDPKIKTSMMDLSRDVLPEVNKNAIPFDMQSFK
jgi:hypothetical protein